MREGHGGEQENKSSHGAKLWATNMGDIHEEQEECRCPLGGQGGRERERGHLSGHQKAAVVLSCFITGIFELLLVV